jgi:ankyrin repeat protein
LTLEKEAPVDKEFAPSATAILTGNLSALDELLSADPALATRRSSCSHPTLLQLVACEEANIPDPVGAARVLVFAGAETWFPLVAAAGCNSVRVVDFLLDNGTNIDRTDAWTPLDEALYWANLNMAARLVHRGAAVHSLRAAAGLGATKLVDEFFSDGILASQAGPVRSPFPETVPDTIANDHGAIVDNAFVMAVNNGYQATAQQLHDKGARVNEKAAGFHWHGTALHAAVWRNDRVLVEWLLSIGADPTIRDGLAHSDAVGWANHHGHLELAAQLQRL